MTKLHMFLHNFIQKKLSDRPPFYDFFKMITPEIFVYLFKYELEQTTALVLSFCRSRRFVKKVLKLLNNQETAEYIADYLSNCEDKYIDPEVVGDINRCCRNLLENYTETKSQLYRTNMTNVLKRKM